MSTIERRRRVSCVSRGRMTRGRLRIRAAHARPSLTRVVRGALLVGMLVVWCVPGMTGCATRVTVDVREQDAIASKQRWRWAEAGEASAPPAIPGSPGLRGRVVVTLERALERRGYAKSTEAPEFRVAVELQLALEIEERYEAGAIGFLPSFDHTPSYEYQTSEPRETRFHRVVLLLVITDEESGRVLWRSRLTGRYADGFGAHVGEAVEALIEGLPGAVEPGAPDPPRNSPSVTAGLRGEEEAVSLCGPPVTEYDARAGRNCHPNRGHP